MIYFGFTETENFVRRATQLLGDDGIAKLQSYLCDFPDDGNVVPSSDGIRKMRWASSGRGQRGGARIIYYYAVADERILLIDIYAKNEKADLTKDELERCRKTVAVWLGTIRTD